MPTLPLLLLATALSAAPTPTPAPSAAAPSSAQPADFSPAYHICGANLYDPSAPILKDDGTWHLFQDAGGWSHYTSRDLLHWTPAPPTHFSGMTGSISVTPNGTYAIWPDRGQTIFNRSQALDANLTQWGAKTTVIRLPAGAKKMQDPARALQLPDGHCEHKQLTPPLSTLPLRQNPEPGGGLSDCCRAQGMSRARAT